MHRKAAEREPYHNLSRLQWVLRWYDTASRAHSNREMTGLQSFNVLELVHSHDSNL
jgi:hypothetical protein